MSSRNRINKNHHYHGGASRRDTGRKPRPELKHSTPKQIADAIAFENGLGGGSDCEYRNIVRAAELGYEAGLAACPQSDPTTVQPKREQEETGDNLS